MKQKKLLALLMAGCMTLGMAGVVQAEEPAWTNDDTAEITILYKGDNVPDADNIVIQELEKRTNTQINIIYVSSGESTTKRNAMVASGEMPDIFFVDNVYANELKEQGLIADLTDVLTAVAPEMLETYSEELNLVPANKDGLYMIPNMKTPYVIELVIRKDWLDNLGLEMPTDLESFAQVMHAFTYDDPDGNGEDDTFGLAGSMEVMSWGNTFASIFGAYGIPAYRNIELEDGTVTSWVKHPNFIEAMQYIKALIDDGVVEPDFMTIPAMSMYEKLWTGTAGAMEFMGHGPLANWMPGRYVEDPLPVFDYTVLEGPYGDSGTQEVYLDTNYGFAVAADTENMEGVARIIKFCNSDEGNELLFMGVEGVMYEWVDKEEGTYQRLGDYVDDALQRQHGGWVYSEMFTPKTTYEVKTMEKQAQEALAYFEEHAIEWPNVVAVNEVYTEYGADMSQVISEMMAELLQTDAEEMQAVYEDYMSEWEAVGGTDWEVEQTALWNAQNE